MIEQVRVGNDELVLYPEKVAFIPRGRVLLISDMHLGKVNHFRRSGIPVPRKANDGNMDRLIRVLQDLKPVRVLFMGDLFHSHYNPEWEVFGQVLRYFPTISFELIVGNHDIMSDYQYLKHQLLMHGEPLSLGRFLISHEPMEEIPAGSYNIAGHIHPGVKLRGGGRQALRLPCFSFGRQQALMPAFGEFTGLYMIRPQPEDQIFVIADGRVIRV